MLRRSVTLGSRSDLKTKVQSGQLTAVSGETQEKRAALSQIRGLARRTCCAVGRGYARSSQQRMQHSIMAHLIASTRMQEYIGAAAAECGSKVIYFMIAHWDSNAATVCMIRCSVQQGCASCVRVYLPLYSLGVRAEFRGCREAKVRES